MPYAEKTPQRKIRLLIVTHYLDKGGVEEVILMYAKFLDKKKYDIVVACRTGGTTAQEIQSLGVPVRYFESDNIWQRFHALWKIAGEFKPDIVHNHFTWHGLLVGAALGVPRIETIHNTYYWFTGFQKFGYGLYSCLASRIIAVSGNVRRFTLEFFPFISSNKISVIHNGVDIQHFAPRADRSVLRSEMGIDAEEIVLGFIGRLEKQKGLTYLLDAFKLIQSESKTKLMIVGDGSFREELTKKAKALSLDISFEGFQRDTAKYLQAFDVFILPSLFEGLPVSLIEAMASGLPVIATRIGGVDEVVENNISGLLVEPKNAEQLAEAIRTLASNTDLRQKMGAEARKRAMHEFSVEAMLAKNELIYNEVLHLV